MYNLVVILHLYLKLEIYKKAEWSDDKYWEEYQEQFLDFYLKFYAVIKVEGICYQKIE